MHRSIAVLSLVALLGCGDDDGTSMMDMGTDGDVLGPCEGRPTSIDDDDIRTPYPNQSWIWGPLALRPVNVNYVITDDGDARGPLVEMFAEIRNQSAVQCNIAATATIDGTEITGVVWGVAYTVLDSPATEPCVAMGETGVFYGVGRGLTEADLEASSEVVFESIPDTSGSPVEARAPGITGLSVRGQADGSAAVAGTIIPVEDVFGYTFRAFPRDDRGVFYDELTTTVEDGATLTTGSSYPFVTESNECAFTAFFPTPSWTVGTASGFTGELGGPLPERVQRFRDRLAAMDAIVQLQR